MAMRDEFKIATARAREARAKGPFAVSARYDRETNRVIVELNTRLAITFLPEDAQGLEGATARQLEEIEVSPGGTGIHFPKLDADIYVPALLQGMLGSRNWMAAQLGQRGGRSRSRAKKRASRANGRSGGRPRKTG